MSAPDIFPPPVLDLSPPPEDKRPRERLAFYRLLPDLLKTHRGQYVAIHEGHVVASGPESLAVAVQAYKEHPPGPIYVGWVNDPPTRRARISGPRAVRDQTPS